MAMRTLILELPDQLELEEVETRIILAGELYRRGKLSLGQAAHIAQLQKRSFIEMMGKYGFSMFSDDPEEVLADFRNA